MIKYSLLFVACLSLSLTSPLVSLESDSLSVESDSDLQVVQNQNQSKDFFVLTIPKSGSHLILKMLAMLTGKNRIFPLRNRAYVTQNHIETISKYSVAYWKQQGLFPVAHFDVEKYYANMCLMYPEFVKIINVRDLRDVCVSGAIYFSSVIEKAIGPCDFDQKLLFIMTLGEYNKQSKLPHYLYIEHNARQAIKWMQDPTVLVCRFESLIGEQGGGTLKEQEQQIIEIANHLNIPLTTNLLNQITSDLFGNERGPQIPTTFREGKIQSWKKSFNEEHHRVFREVFGELQLQLGYSLD